MNGAIRSFGLAALVLFSVGFRYGDAPKTKLGEPFDLRGGESVSVEGELTLTFVAVPQDSRCPKGEQCITAGKARILLEAVVRDASPVKVELETGAASEAGEIDVSGFRISLLGLSPYPSVVHKIIFQDYVAKLTVHRL